MGRRDPRIDTYIKKSADFARPVLEHFRILMHKYCPDVEETIKWGFPHFDYQHGPLSSMASFKQHCAISFWKAALMKNSPELSKMAESQQAMGHLGKVKGLSDLPSERTLVKYIKEGMRLNEEGVKLSPKSKSAVPQKVQIPVYFKTALSQNKKATVTFDKLSNSQKKEYVNWVTEAKTEVTKIKRLKTSIEWLSQGKVRNWKYL